MLRRHVMCALVLLGGCGSSTSSSPAKSSDWAQPIHDTQSLPTSSTPEPVPTTSSTVAPIPPTPVATAKASAAPSASSSSAKTGALTKEECAKIVRKFAENVAMDKNAELKEGFDKIPMFQTMVDECVANSTRKQYDCVMATKTMAEWMGCMR